MLLQKTPHGCFRLSTLTQWNYCCIKNHTIQIIQFAPFQTDFPWKGFEGGKKKNFKTVSLQLQQFSYGLMNFHKTEVTKISYSDGFSLILVFSKTY